MDQDINSFDYLFDQYKQLHREEHAFRGKMVPVLVERVGQLVKQHDAQTLLDYGCGKAEHYLVQEVHKSWGIMPTLYDPGYESFEQKPVGTFDGVICNDVAEHVPEKHVGRFLTDVFSHANFFVLMCIFVEPAKATLPDGRNAHLTIQPPAWWGRQVLMALGGFASGTKVQGWGSQKGLMEFVHPSLHVVTYFRTKANKKLDQ